ncbi:ABC transporter ATP-binding protein [Desulfolithobacter dissulfuricans]|uniref:ABC transporter ATP-binding protein n=1 Tax=Desulfolithobacter dissulfuricans TaxID=2795293 RepID=A0A915XLL8_9BACT|nr:ATP-binding cassette domain-containing protein [Desulfolithobacter dissulfuricans]BCO10031.1 ABC transporter ATP-binding protein [Desulfolithobacter dissulfuricans]
MTKKNARPGKSVIVIRDLSFSYGERLILENVNLVIHEREMIGIIGPNGGGKTTLLKLILGLLKPDRGSVLVFGQPPEKVAHRIGYVPQHMQFDDRFPVSVLDVVLMGLAGRGGLGPLPGKMKEKALQTLDRVELSAYAHHPFAGLSGGQRQRVLIARALAGEPEMLLFDEPTANVDSRAGEKLYAILHQLNQEMTILVVSHDIGFVNQQITSVVCVNQQVQIHPTSELAGHNIIDLYGRDIALIRHDHRCSPEGHSCSSS